MSDGDVFFEKRFISHIVSESTMDTHPVPVFKKKILDHSYVKDSLKWIFSFLFGIYLNLTIGVSFLF